MIYEYQCLNEPCHYIFEVNKPLEKSNTIEWCPICHSHCRRVWSFELGSLPTNAGKDMDTR